MIMFSKYFLVHLANRNRKISRSLSTITNPPMIMGITLTVTSRRMRILSAQRNHQIKNGLPEVTFPTPFIFLLLPLKTRFLLPMANTKNGSRKERSSRYRTWLLSRTSLPIYAMTPLTTSKTDFRRFFSISTPIQSNLHPTDRRRIASRGARRSYLYQRTRSLDHLQNRFIDSRIRFPTPCFRLKKV